MSVPANSASQPSTEPQRPGSRAWRVFRWCLPNRVDGLVLLCGTMVLLAIAEPIFQSVVAWMGGWYDFDQLGLAFMAVAGCAAGVAATAGLGRLKLSRGVILLFVCLLTLAALVFATFQLSIPDLEMFFGRNQRQVFSVIGDGAAEFWIKFLIGGLLAGSTVFVFTWMISWLFKRFSNRSGQRKITRSKILVASAVILFIVGTIQNIFFPRGFLAGASHNVAFGSPAIQMIAMVALGLIAALILLVLPCHLLTRSGKRRWKVLTVVGAGVFLVVILIMQQAYFFMFRDSGYLIVVFLVFEPIFLWTVLLACKDWAAVPAEPLQDRRATMRTTSPSVWSLFVIAVLVAIGAVISLFDLPTLVTSLGQNWEAARLVKTVARKSSYQISVMPNWGGYMVICKFDQNTDPNVLEIIDQKLLDLPIVAGQFTGLSPGVSTIRLRGKLTTSVAMQKCLVTSDQLNDLASSSVAYTNLNDVDVVDPSASVKIGRAGACMIVKSGPKRIDSLLAAIAPAKDGNVRLFNYLNEYHCDQVELDAIVNLSQRISVTIDQSIFDDFVATGYQPTSSMQNVNVNGMGHAEFAIQTVESNGTASPHLRFLFQNDLFLDEGAADDQRLFWDLAFGKNVATNPYYVDKISPDSLANASMFREDSDQFHWKFGENEKHRVTELFLPTGEMIFDQLDLTNAEMSHFNSLETLSFDPLWLNRPSPLNTQGTVWQQKTFNYVNLLNLGALPRLKRLDLGMNALVSDQTFLNSIPNIEHLQIGLEDSIKPLVDFSVCKNLKTLVYFGTPPKITAKQLATLPNLESVTFVDGGDIYFVGQTAIKNLKKSIPGVKVTVIPEAEFLPRPPESFLKHVQKRSAEIKAFYLDGESR